MTRRLQHVGLGNLLFTLVLATRVHAAPPVQSPLCDYYVDSNVSSDGDGSWSNPWQSINDNLGDLVPGDTMCVRGDVSDPGRVYKVNEIRVDSEGGTVRDGVPGNPITVRSYPGEKVILRNVGGDSTIYFRGADYWIFEGFVIDNNGRGRQAIRFKLDANHNILRSNVIYNGGGTGIAFYGGLNVGNVVENNHIHHFDAGDRGANCIILNPGSDDTIIRGNVIHDCSGDGIHIYAVDDTPISEYSKNVQIVDNLLYRGTLSRSEDGIAVKGSDGLVVAGNEFSGYYYDNTGMSGRAVVVLKGSRNILLERNVVHDAGAGVNCHGEGGNHPENIIIKNNLFDNISIGDRYAILFVDVHGAIVYHNTIANSTARAFRVSGNGLYNGDIRNNLIYNSRGADIQDSAPFVNVTIGYNGWFDAEGGRHFAAPTDIVGNGDPGFVDAVNGDYHLRADSQVRDAGIDVGVTADFEGDARPFGSRPDIGADEYTPCLYLRASPHDRAIHLVWTEYEHSALASYVISYTYDVGGSDAIQGPSPILDVPTTTHVYSLTDIPNYVLYTVSVSARDGAGVDLVTSNSVRVMPTDIFVYLPTIVKGMTQRLQ